MRELDDHVYHLAAYSTLIVAAQCDVYVEQVEQLIES